MTGQQLKASLLQYAVQGKLVAQEPTDEEASVLLDRIRAERARLVAQGKIKAPKHESSIYKWGSSWYERSGGRECCIDELLPFDIPPSWQWVRLGEIVEIIGGVSYDKKDIRSPLKTSFKT